MAKAAFEYLEKFGMDGQNDRNKRPTPLTKVQYGRRSEEKEKVSGTPAQK